MKQFVIASLICLSVFHSFSQTSSKPNIIFILADDLGYGDVGCYGQQKIATPNIDWLARMGVKFTQFYAGSTVCAPSRCSFMTGMHTGHAAIRGNVTLKPEGQFPLSDTIVTLAMLLKQAGYTTAAFGKWSLGFITTSGDPQKKGFDEFYGYNCQTLAHNYYPNHLWHNHDRIDLPGNLKKDSIYSADLIHQQAMKFLNAKHNQPFFLYLPYTLPHADVIVPHDEVYNHYVNKFGEQPQAKTGNENAHFDPYPHATFAAMVSRLDKFVGEIINAVKEKGIEKNTLIIFTSDNGPHKEGGGDPPFFNSNGGLRGIKRDLYEGGIRVPFIACQPGVTKPGTVNAMPAAFWDLFPTFLEMANVSGINQTDGSSLVKSLRGQKQTAHPYFYWELHESGGKQALRLGNWKGVKLNVSTQENPTIELYDLSADPHEKNDVSSTHPEIVQKIETMMKQAYTPNKDWPLKLSELKK